MLLFMVILASNAYEVPVCGCAITLLSLLSTCEHCESFLILCCAVVTSTYILPLEFYTYTYVILHSLAHKIEIVRKNGTWAKLFFDMFLNTIVSMYSF